MYNIRKICTTGPK
ncbi:hypothetical protein Taro_024302 [Colocasia esculenta]|uniref:Uncharacterized protein n=1 Tax=Colocasia esculenta TaxID=4460 RepID=A0A843V607_COLES|nr:hypothetical protein [Colocasia esculenta]